MHINKTLPLALALTSVAAPAFAVDKGETYLGGGFARVNFDTDEQIQGDEIDFDPTAFVGRVGYGIADNFAIEGRLGYGFSDDSISRSGSGNVGTITVDIDQIAGIYAVSYIPISDAFSLYGITGFTNTEITVTVDVNNVTGFEDSGDNSGFSYGAGAELGITDEFSGYVEWVRYLDEDDVEVSGLTAGAKYSF